MPPRVRFLCDMFHPNVYQDGTLCLDIIQDHWNPIYNVSSLLTSIVSLLMDPNCSSPANPECARMFLNDRKAYNRRVRAVASKSVENP
jgi:ubiquitin-conjugating enzyme E2 A